jgi:hypothetical protein
MVKPSTKNIISWWFAADTPIRQYKMSLNPQLKWACEQVSRDFVAPSGATKLASYRRSDKLAFAQAVQQMLRETSMIQTTQAT